MDNKTRHLSLAFLTALGLSLVWLLIGKDYYDYGWGLNFLGINILALTLWIFGLFAMYIIYLVLRDGQQDSGFLKELIFFSTLFWLLLILGETFFYHVLNFHDLATAGYAGLPICDCLHAPTFMKIVYFSMGPSFFVPLNVLTRLKKE